MWPNVPKLSHGHETGLSLAMMMSEFHLTVKTETAVAPGRYWTS